MRKRIALCILFATVFTGCKSSSSGNELSGPPEVVWDEAREAITFRGSPGTVTFYLKGGDYMVYALGLPAGTKLRFGADSQQAAAGAETRLRFEMAAQVAALPLGDAFDAKFKLDPKQTLTITFPGNHIVAVPAAAVAARHGLNRWFGGVHSGAAVFAGEPMTAAKAHTVMVWKKILMGAPVVIGPAKSVSDIDLVAIANDEKPHSGRTCEGYIPSGGTGKETPHSYVLSMRDQTVNIYDRRTGKIVKSKLFPGEDKCPSSAFSTKGVVYSYPRDADIVAWATKVRTAI